MTRPPVPPLPARQAPPVVPATPRGTVPQSPYELTLFNPNSNTTTDLRVVRMLNGAIDSAGTPQFTVASAPALVDTLNTDTAAPDNINYADVPPEQGKTSVAIDFSKGLNQDPLGHYTRGNYQWGESVWTVDTGGLLLRAPELVTLGYGAGVAALTARVESVCVHNFVDGAAQEHSTTWFSAGHKVYYLDELDGLAIKEPPTQPAGASRITCIFSWQGILLVAHDTVDPYEWSDDDGTTWHLAGTGGGHQGYGKFFASYSETSIPNNPALPVLVMSNDPNFVYSTEDPKDSSQWDTGSIVGQGGAANPDHNTSLNVAPTGELLVGKALNLFQLEQAQDGSTQAGTSVSGDVALRMGPVAQSTDAGEENFAWPCSIGYSSYYVLRDFDIVRLKPQRLSQGFTSTLLTPTVGFGPSFKLPSVSEAQKPIVSICSDSVKLLFAALGGDEGRVLVGCEDPSGQTDNGWQWHGCVAATGYPIRFIWTNSFPLSSAYKDTWLFMAGNEAPFTLKAMRVPRINAFYDSGITFVTTCSARLGKDYAGQAQVQKVFSRATPNTRNLNYNLTASLSYRVLEGAGFTFLNSFDHSPLPLGSDLLNTYLPNGVAGTFVELEIGLTGVTNVAAAFESVEYEAFRRPVRKDLVTTTVYADNAGMTRAGGRRNASWAQLRAELQSCRDAIAPPLLTDRETGVVWTVDLQQFSTRWLQDNNGNAAALVVDLTMQELDTHDAPAVGGPSGGPPAVTLHVHMYEEYVSPGGSLTLPYVPIVEPEVFAGRSLLFEGLDYTWTPGSPTLTFTVAQTSTIRVFWPRYL